MRRMKSALGMPARLAAVSISASSSGVVRTLSTAELTVAALLGRGGGRPALGAMASPLWSVRMRQIYHESPYLAILAMVGRRF